MRAAILEKNGPVDSVVLGELPAPRLGRDEILVRVHASSVNPADVKVCTGRDGGGFIHARKFPMAVGFDFSGVVEEVGAGVTTRSVGDAVFGHLPYSPTTRQGSLAELVAVKPGSVGVKPESVPHEQAAAAATVGCTALQGLRDRGRLQAGQRVLVNGASGGVGSYAVQIARLLGAEVWGTASAAKADFVRSLGAAEVVDYRATPVEAIDGSFDVLLDAASMSSFGKTKHLLNRGGAYVTLLPSLGFLGGFVQSLLTSRRCAFVTVQSRESDLEQLARWIASGELAPCVQQTFPISEVSAALAALEGGTVRGKLAVRVV